MANDPRGSNGPSPVEDKRVFVVGGDRHVSSLFAHYGANIVQAIKFADVVVFTGGADVAPILYDQRPLSSTHYDIERDKYEVLMYKLAKDKMKVGICRGAQFLNVMNGGSLWQHVDNHGRTHMTTYVTRKGGTILVPLSSTHHQVMRLPKDMSSGNRGYVWAWASQSTKLEDDHQVTHTSGDHAKDLEIIFYPKSHSLCFQPHPEFPGDQYRRTRDIFVDCLARLDHACAALQV